MTDSSLFGIFFPDETVPAVDDVDYGKLIDSGIEAVIFDLDNPLAKWGDDSLPGEIIELFEQLTSMGLKVGILTNSQRETIKNFIVELPFPHVFDAGKPRIQGFRSILDELDVSPEKAVMIGDQLFTDVFGANRMNMYTVRVDPIDPDKEFSLTKINRLGEKALLYLRDFYRLLR